MNARHSFLGKMAKVLLVFAAFIGSLCAVLYIGFEMKFSSPKQSQEQAQLGAKPTFYKQIGITSPQLKSNHKPSPQMAAKYTLELQMVNSQADAEKLVNQLAQQGIKAYYTPYQSRGRVFFRVRQGLYTSQATAQSQADQLKKSKNLPVTVIKLQ